MPIRLRLVRLFGILTGLFVVFACTVGLVHGQSQIQGTVTDGKNGKPLPRAHVFFQGTAHATTTNDAGHFSLNNVEPGSYTLVASMVGYDKTKKSLRLYSTRSSSTDTVRTLTIELPRNVMELKGVSVKTDRDEWLDRLDEFRSSFFGETAYADACEFLNPEVLSFEERDDDLVAYASKPLHVRNEALGYEITLHMSRYEATADGRYRYGHYEFDPLQAEDRDQREDWQQARVRAYRGSFRHFIHALAADSVDEEGFRMELIERPRPNRKLSRSAQKRPSTVDRREIFEATSSPNQAILTTPHHSVLEVRYVRKAETHQFARQYRGRDRRSWQTSWIQILGGSSVLINTDSGDFVPSDIPGFGHYFLNGYWGWYETGATLLPSGYRPPDV